MDDLFFIVFSAVTPQSSMTKPRSWQWEHFHSGEMKNSAYRNAFCNYCVNFQLKVIVTEDEQAIIEGRLRALRHKEEQLKDGVSSLSA